MGTIVEDVRARIGEARTKLKTRVEEWRERGWRAGSHSSNSQFPVIQEVREKGLAAVVKSRREKRLEARRKRLAPKPEEEVPEEEVLEEAEVPEEVPRARRRFVIAPEF